jgi:hypothetical protein
MSAEQRDPADTLRYRDFVGILADVKFGDWRFHVGSIGLAYYLQVQAEVDDNWEASLDLPAGPRKIEFKGRKWLLSRWMTRSEVVQTALMAVLAAVEHEAREQFLYRGAAIFGPHHDVGALRDLPQDVRP